MKNAQPAALQMLYALTKSNLAVFMVSVFTLAAGVVFVMNRIHIDVLLPWVLSLWIVALIACYVFFRVSHSQLGKLMVNHPAEAARFEEVSRTAKSFRKILLTLKQEPNPESESLNETP